MGGVDAERLVRGVAVATLSAPLLVLTQLLTGATGPSAPALLGALVTVAATAALLGGTLGAGTARTALATGAAQLAGYAVLAAAGPGTATGCLPAVSRGAGVLLGFDIPADRCVAAGPYTVVGGAITCVMVAAGILLGHALLAGLGARLMVLTGSALRVAVTVAGAAREAVRLLPRLLPRLPGPVGGPGEHRPLSASPAAPRPATTRHPAGRPVRRGPPALPAPLPA